MSIDGELRNSLRLPVGLIKYLVERRWKKVSLAMKEKMSKIPHETCCTWFDFSAIGGRTRNVEMSDKKLHSGHEDWWADCLWLWQSSRRRSSRTTINLHPNRGKTCQSISYSKQYRILRPRRFSRAFLGWNYYFKSCSAFMQKDSSQSRAVPAVESSLNGSTESFLLGEMKYNDIVLHRQEIKKK